MSNGLTRIVNACRYSAAGLRATFAGEQAFRQEVYTLCVLLPAGYWLGGNGAERALLMGSLLIVPIIELLNTGLEAVVDRVGPEHHELAGLAKDAGSAAVFLSIGLACLVWCLILVPRLL